MFNFQDGKRFLQSLQIAFNRIRQLFAHPFTTITTVETNQISIVMHVNKSLIWSAIPLGNVIRMKRMLDLIKPLALEVSEILWIALDVEHVSPVVAASVDVR